VFQSDFDLFKTVLSDLCIAVNRPFTDDLLRVFWEDLKGVPLQQVKLQASLLRATGKMKFVSSDLRPQQQESKPINTGPSLQDQLAAFVVKHYAHRLTARQISRPWTYLYRGFPGTGGDPKDFRSKPSDDFAVTGVVIPSDGDAPGLSVMAEEMRLEYAA
jgi:hypothetical protein